ncbi:MAG: hypothetical protein WCH78_06755 [Bacteroidota bacterium]
MASSLGDGKSIRNYSSWLLMAPPGMNSLNPFEVPTEASRLSAKLALSPCSDREAYGRRRDAANQRAAPVLAGALASALSRRKNTQVFAVFDKSRTVLALRSDLSTRSFTTGNIPLRAKITLVSISKIGHDLYLGIKIINDVGTVINYSITPEQKSLGQILDYLNAL